MKVNIKTSRKAMPRCYAYTTPTVASHDGWIKIGYTEQDDVETRIGQQLKTANIPHKTEWSDIAVFTDGKTYFTDDDFHKYLTKQGIERMRPMPGDKKPPEWFRISGNDSYMQFCNFRRDKGVLKSLGTMDYVLRDEQQRAVNKTYAFFENNSTAEFLWNAKPRFGKTLAAYDLCICLKKDCGENACNILIVTNRPAIANSWYDDYVKFVGGESGLLFVSDVSALKDKPYVLTRQKYLESLDDNAGGCIEFVSLQDLKGSVYFGGEYEKLSEIREMKWDLLIIDEAHEGVDTSKTDIAFTQITRKHTLHLSGTPFKALANAKFDENAIFNWTYADEQQAKANWNYANGRNPYEDLPRLNLFTYQMSEIVREELEKGIEINGESEEYAFDLNLFFSTKANGSFVYESSVDRFLDALTLQEKFPFSTPELRDELKHTFWLLDRVDSAKALAKKLEQHPVFKEYKTVLAAGDGRLSENEAVVKSYDKVREAIDNNEKTITLSVGQLTTGITVPEWTGVLMLSNIKSPALYMQAAFRSQNPWRYQENGELYVKENAYVFDFDPARTLIIFEEFANDLSAGTSGGKGGSDERRQNVRELLNFFPVIGEDENGEMIELDAEKVLSIPRKIRSLEVVRRGFMSNFLFQNIANIFNAPQEVINIISQLPNAPEGDIVDVSKDTRDNLFVNDDGEVEIPREIVVGTAKEVFGEEIYNITNVIEEKAAEVINTPSPEHDAVENLKKVFLGNVVEPVMNIASEKYGEDLRVNDTKQLKKQLEQKAGQIIEREYGAFSIQKNIAEKERRDELSRLDETGKTENQVNEEFEAKIQDVTNTFTEKLSEAIKESVPAFCEDVVQEAETKKREHVKESIEDSVREHLRGFARTIPSFLMAYGDENTSLETFDNIISDSVFIEVTSISLEQFRFLRDGGDYIDDETGEERHYQGKLFDPVVFNDSIKEFLSLKSKLSDYFSDAHTEDIFDYIPPQKTNQIYTPKNIVVRMVDMLEEENPGCFDDPDKTFIDLYMKSGLYISEIVKRLYRSEKMIELFPDSGERLKHIFEKQVYGLAPTEIIYHIATNFILGFDSDSQIDTHNFKQADTLPYAKNGTLEEYLDTLFK